MTMLRIVAIALCVLSGPMAGLSQTMGVGDGALWFPTVGLPSTLLPVAMGDTMVLPVRIGLEWGMAPSFILHAAPGDAYTVSFATTASHACGEIQTAFEGDALYWIEHDARLDPNAVQTLACDSTGTASFSIGITVTLPASWKAEYTWIGITCTAVSQSSGDTLSGRAEIEVRYILGTPYDIDGKLTDLARGTTYTQEPQFGEASLYPVRSGRERGWPARMVVHGIGSELIRIEWLLPDSLEDSDGARIPCSFAMDAVRDEASGRRVDPHQPDTLSIDACGALTIDLGITVTVPANAAPGAYSGQVIWSATYIGNQSTPLSRKPGDAEIIFTVHVSGEDLPESYALLQNYPNPFNAATAITFALPKPEEVSLTVYDLLGRTMAVLANGPLTAGWHTANWDAGVAASGVYFYALRTPTTALVRKLLLVR
jgi:hypothetical protein